MLLINLFNTSFIPTSTHLFLVLKHTHCNLVVLNRASQAHLSYWHLSFLDYTAGRLKTLLPQTQLDKASAIAR